MTINSDDELAQLRDIGWIVSHTMHVMADALEPGMTTLELDAIGAAEFEREGARSAPCHHL